MTTAAASKRKVPEEGSIQPKASPAKKGTGPQGASPVPAEAIKVVESPPPAAAVAPAQRPSIPDSEDGKAYDSFEIMKSVIPWVFCLQF